jgi:hypothetical protein
VQKVGISDKGLRVGELVLVSSENQKKFILLLTVIQELYLCRNSHVRVVKVKTTLDYFVRTVQQIYTLEDDTSGNTMFSDEDSADGLISTLLKLCF